MLQCFQMVQLPPFIAANDGCGKLHCFVLDTLHHTDFQELFTDRKDTSMGECNTILRAYTKYGHLGQYCTHSSNDMSSL